MARPFDYFIILAEMRTGSNLLETHINSFGDLTCFGEAFNPHFIGHPKDGEILGLTLEDRERDPARLLTAIRDDAGHLGGFRYFHDHDPRVLGACLDDRRCAKIILTRNPVDSYISWKIAKATGQWKLTNVKHKRDARVRFDESEFTALVSTRRAFAEEVRVRLQSSGQTAFQLDYSDLNDLAVINGLGRFLATAEPLEALGKSVKKQNPGAMEDKVVNFSDMTEALARLDFWGLGRDTVWEPLRGPGVPGYRAAGDTGALFLPLEGPDRDRINGWLSELAQSHDTEMVEGFTQKSLRQWKRAHPGHRSFTAVSHPVPRAHWAFCETVLTTGSERHVEIRETLRRIHSLPIPDTMPDDSYDKVQHRQAFLAFLAFVKQNLAGQTAIRVDTAWASQSQSLAAISRFAPPDMILRRENLHDGLAGLAAILGYAAAKPAEAAQDHPYPLDEIYDAEVEAAVRAAYQRDYMMFGYGPWKA